MLLLRVSVVAGLAILSACGGADSNGRERSSEGAGLSLTPSIDSALTPVPFDSLFDIAESLFYGGEADSAQVMLTSLRAQARAGGHKAAEARSWTWIGLAAWRLGDYEESARLGNEALAFKLEHGLEDQYYRSYNALGLIAWNLNRYSEAAVHFEKAVEYAEQFGNRRAAAVARGNLGLIVVELGEFDQAREYFTTMRHVMVEVEDQRFEGTALTNLGMLAIRLGDPLAGIPLLNEALSLYAAVDYPTGRQAALGQLGMAYAMLGESNQALAALDEALAEARREGLRQDEAAIYEGMAEIYRSAGDFTRALDLYGRAKFINAELGLDVETGEDLRGESDIHARLGDYRRSEQLALEALEIHQRAGAPFHELQDRVMLAESLERQDRLPEAGEQIEVSRKLADQVGARVARLEVALAEARIADRRRQSAEVLSALERVEEDLSRGGYNAEWEARLLVSRAYERLGRIESAAVAGRRALATVERARGNFGSAMLQTAFVADKREVYAHLVSVLLRLGETEEAFEVADAARGRTMIQQLSATNRSAEDATSAFGDGEVLLREIDRLAESVKFFEETAPEDRTETERRDIQHIYARLEQERSRYELLHVQAQEANPRAAAFLGGASTDADAVRRSLAANQLLLEYFVPHEGQVVVFIVSQGGINVIEAPITVENLTSRVRLVRDLIARSAESSDRTAAVLSGLHEVLIQPVIHAGLVSDADELIVVPHDVLSYLPFAALLDETTDRFLVEDYVIRVLPSAAAVPALTDRSGHGLPQDASVFAPFPDELPGTRDEVRAIAVAGRVRRFEGAQASERELRKALASPRLVHVATHGVMNAINPMFSRLELSRSNGDDTGDDGRLEVHELFELTIVAPLVFLSGCETGVGAARSTAFQPGEDYATLAQAFLYAGADNVIATLWKVEDDAAAQLAGLFYEALDGKAPAEALAEAQRALLSQERYSAPYYWAAYQVAGLNSTK